MSRLIARVRACVGAAAEGVDLAVSLLGGARQSLCPASRTGRTATPASSATSISPPARRAAAVDQRFAAAHGLRRRRVLQRGRTATSDCGTSTTTTRTSTCSSTSCGSATSFTGASACGAGSRPCRLPELLLTKLQVVELERQGHLRPVRACSPTSGSRSRRLARRPRARWWRVTGGCGARAVERSRPWPDSDRSSQAARRADRPTGIVGARSRRPARARVVGDRVRWYDEPEEV